MQIFKAGRVELNIGHFIVSQAVYEGIGKAVAEMIRSIKMGRGS